MENVDSFATPVLPAQLHLQSEIWSALPHPDFIRSKPSTRSIRGVDQYSGRRSGSSSKTCGTSVISARSRRGLCLSRCHATGPTPSGVSTRRRRVMHTSFVRVPPIKSGVFGRSTKFSFGCRSESRRSGERSHIQPASCIQRLLATPAFIGEKRKRCQTGPKHGRTIEPSRLRIVMISNASAEVTNVKLLWRAREQK